jgi:hypothetical protein
VVFLSHMYATASSEESTCGISIKREQVFDPVTVKIDNKYANASLEDVPNLAAECSITRISELLGEKVFGREDFSAEYSPMKALEFFAEEVW